MGSAVHLTAVEMCPDGVVTPKEACRILACGLTTHYDLMNSGALPYCRVGMARRIPRAALMRYLASSLTSGRA